MSKKRKAVKITTYVAGILAVTSSVLVAVLLIMSAMGIIFPRKQSLVLRTNDIAFTYSGEVFCGSEPWIAYGSLLPGHVMEVIDTAQYANVGEYENKPEFVILDSVGADVTDMYKITAKYGKMRIDPRHLTVYSESKEKRYDGKPLTSDAITVTGGSLAEGHIFVCNSSTSITLPGEQKILPNYSITDGNNTDVTDQYDVSELLGELTVLPISITVTTASAQKEYDGTPISENKWQHTSGNLLAGHRIETVCISEQTEVGEYINDAVVRVYDKNDKDVTRLYDITLVHGILCIDPIVLHITTGSASKEYDGKYLSCKEWSITYGSLAEDEIIKAVSYRQQKDAGESKNEISFEITDKNGKNITDRYKIILDTGVLSVSPRAITIQTGSATKKYDGGVLYCDDYKITKGSLCEGDKLEISFTSIVNIGYTENYVIDRSIYTVSTDGNRIDVTVNYKITYDYGTLTVTAE